MNTLENLEMVLFDFDDTLCIHNHRSDAYEEMMEYLSYIHSGETFPKSWNKAKPNLQLKKFMDYLAYKNIPMGLISGVRDCKTAERKIKWVKENYGYLLENYCVSSQEQKIIELKVLAKVNRLHENQIAIIDDLYPNLEKAESEGFVALSPMQVVNLFNEISEQKSATRIVPDCDFPLQDELKNKYIFWDIDGTLAEYRFNGHVSDPEGTNNGMSLKEIDDGVFLKRKPSYHMQLVLSTCGAKQNIVMGHCQVQKEMDDKQLWLDKYYPSITERLLVSEDKSKADTILQYCKDHDISLQNVIFVDDTIPFLREAERNGIVSFHISSFLDWDFERRQKC